MRYLDYGLTIKPATHNKGGGDREEHIKAEVGLLFL